jgi:D-alanine-D-alanine ligase-like ATP-grasp enzyme
VSQSSILNAVKSFSSRDRVFLVQKAVNGRDYRIVVLNDEVISAYERTPLTVVGNGRSSVRKLLEKKQDHFAGTGRDPVKTKPSTKQLPFQSV